MNNPYLNTTRKYYPFLDGLRALAVLWVMFHHILYHFNLVDIFGSFSVYVKRVFYLGFLGVDIFFVISGFLITGLLIPDLDKNIRIKRFYGRRFFKIYPQYLFAFVVGVGMIWIMGGGKNISVTQYVGYLFFLQNYISPVREFSHFWSLSVEEHFYLCYPLLIQAICVFQKDITKRLSALLFALIFLVVTGNVLRYFLFQTIMNMNDPIPRQYTHVRFDALMFGCILKLLENKILCLPINKQRIIGACFFIFGMLIFLSFVFYFNVLGWHSYALVYLATGFIIVAALLGFKPVNDILSWRPFIWVGKNSYGIYLWHYIIIFEFGYLGLFIGTLKGVILYIGASIILGYLTTQTIERFFLKQRVRWIP